jgi:hypothetical protein
MRRAVLASLLALSLSAEPAPAAEAQQAPDAYMPDEAAIPDGYELQDELTTRSGQGEILEQRYVNDANESDLRVIAVAAGSEAVARSHCATASERLRGDDFDVQPAVVDGMPGIVAERRMGLSYQRAAYVASGPVCLGVMTQGQEDRLPEGTEAPILHAMVAKGRAN